MSHADLLDEPEVDESAPPIEEVDQPEPVVTPRKAEPLTEAEWERVLGGRKIRIVVRQEQREWAAGREVFCLSCAHAGKAYGDPRRAWCTKHKMLRGNTFPVLCREYVPA